jgi:hypothetical protein
MILKFILKIDRWGCELNLYGSEQDPVMGFSEYSNKLYVAVKTGMINDF